MLERIFQLMEEIIFLNDKLSKDDKLHDDFIQDVQKYLDGEY